MSIYLYIKRIQEEERSIPWFPVPSNPMKMKFTGMGRYIESISESFKKFAILPECVRRGYSTGTVAKKTTCLTKE